MNGPRNGVSDLGPGELGSGRYSPKGRADVIHRPNAGALRVSYEVAVSSAPAVAVGLDWRLAKSDFVSAGLDTRLCAPAREAGYMGGATRET
jgi:hypothetical protein